MIVRQRLVDMRQHLARSMWPMPLLTIGHQALPGDRSLRRVPVQMQVAQNTDRAQLSKSSGKIVDQVKGQLGPEVPLALAEVMAILCAAALQLAAVIQLLGQHRRSHAAPKESAQRLQQAMPSLPAAILGPPELLSFGTGLFVILAMMLSWLRRGMAGPRCNPAGNMLTRSEASAYHGVCACSNVAWVASMSTRCSVSAACSVCCHSPLFAHAARMSVHNASTQRSSRLCVC